MSIKLSKDLEKAIISQAVAGRKAWEAGDLEQAERDFLASWDAIPEPRLDYDFSQSASYGIAVFYRSTGQFLKAKHWLEIVRKAYGPGVASEEYVSFLEATIRYECGELDEAFELFYPQFRIYGNRAFEGEDKKYLDFVKKRVKGK
ncbi:hypothetical protein [Pseudomonas aeruginosa]|uniref:hypothetical protein n=1 Tax=Pseudomonas aeruginosa TaxID=287 RepID=UPI001967C6BC|nr:hypothetical protein [Pseudomonas aeruginosa]HCD6632547.1 hypothetical protein [Pseudomonas aeruginosa]HCD7568820.1 hypothetical protein [Pseudomonas aeruginosa]HCZ9129350.1 hypothetical protein [Pseudomonas aeruginosa]HDQ4733327.1 hypothetical protein [Pseudomonas aeruginosa]